jgi:AMIN domain
VKYSLLSLFALLLVAPVAAHGGEQRRLQNVNKLSIVAENPFQFHIDTTAQAMPQAQMIEGPDRLVIDFPNAEPGSALRRLTVNRGAVRAVRASLYSRQPPVTRIVVDLTLPQWYRIVPDGSGVLVTIGGGASAPSDPGNTIGWVSTKSPVRNANASQPTTITKSKVAASLPRATPVNGVSVDFANGMLTIHASNSTLSEVLFQIQKKTGAEIAIPSGTEQDRVAADFGPGTPSEVLGQLLNGSGLNFVVVGSEADPHALRSVILSRKGPDAGNAAMISQPYTPPVAQNMETETPDPAMAVQGPEVEQQQQQPQQQQMPENVTPTQDPPPPSM